MGFCPHAENLYIQNSKTVVTSYHIHYIGSVSGFGCSPFFLNKKGEEHEKNIEKYCIKAD